jgi:hypothetical protein
VACALSRRFQAVWDGHIAFLFRSADRGGIPVNNCRKENAVAQFDQKSHCPKSWATGLTFDDAAVWQHRDGREFVAVLPRPNGGNLLLVTPDQWRDGWGGSVFEIWPDGHISNGRQAMTTDDFAVIGKISL